MDLMTFCHIFKVPPLLKCNVQPCIGPSFGDADRAGALRNASGRRRRCGRALRSGVGSAGGSGAASASGTSDGWRRAPASCGVSQ